MRILILVAALALAAPAKSYEFKKDVKFEFLDVADPTPLSFAAPLSIYTKEGHLSFSEKTFHPYQGDKVDDYVFVYKPTEEDYLHGFYFKTEVAEGDRIVDEFYPVVDPFDMFLESGEYYALTPLAAQKIAPKFFNSPLKELYYRYFRTFDVDHDVMWIFLVPKKYVDPSAIKDLTSIVDYTVQPNGKKPIFSLVPKFHGSKVTKRELAFEPLVGYPYLEPLVPEIDPYAYPPEHFFFEEKPEIFIDSGVYA